MIDCGLQQALNSDSGLYLVSLNTFYSVIVEKGSVGTELRCSAAAIEQTTY